ncbi:trifunctional transcriptional regulator/proline dehydrogenase/L-glutamate gamma-semialdehyde dehydrogenase [Acinetobacter wanghuae]|uniref:Bifunctional protein PutA n=1 Tax=Acinetobacter wanghuae TaxID=2662362 RepID=A0A5Q0P2Y3_9GAMM|nr:trifunctional transcriptional regulator/proline dehydrogenase/L-glutamate gamma-semialdehyde dehydrogenase [Acinetobacter wanghuae]MQW91608.1 trifunctional transcriptional regulator/proline dehydrogenase/L-glutamate gamma-semialdehyde dehydrogenase [Acinetobacter wanghuae]QGA10962.1 trifunctional transcriptional regulator/proline dehydrogenase/L-glutamate gamma-semialdehyde dehydrogenase [Acinetobacter wanghuae]
MPTTLSQASALDATPSSQHIADFKHKNTYEHHINSAWRSDESECVDHLLAHSKISAEMTEKIQTIAFQLAHSLRERKGGHGKSGVVQGLLQEFSLSSQEGIALMCLAEALLRIPDTATRDLLIRDKINQGNWKDHLGQSQLMFVNAAAWGLMLTGKLMETPQQKSLSSLLTGLLARSGRGIIRKAVDMAMRMMGEQFVTGETINEALKNAEHLEDKGFRYSYDMLGEAALTEHDAERYYQDYQDAIHAIGKASTDQDVYEGPGISIKLSALHPRYQRSQMDRVHNELYAKVLQLAVLAQQYNIGLNIDAEESDRLEISLELLERLCFEPQLKQWKGIGFVIQAYQKRCFYVVDYIIDLAKRSHKRLMIRLVKGAYWDSEIKKAQIDGMTNYPVFTRKVHTDLSYIACARKLLAEPDYIYPQFATHNAQTVATIYQLANPAQYYAGQYEFQCLHGMGEPLYENIVGDVAQHKLGIPCRIYAPVGNHETLLAYLVRRLLENGANTSFVNRIADKALKIEDLIENPRETILHHSQQDKVIGAKHPNIPYPEDLYGDLRPNSAGIDLANDTDLIALNKVAVELSNTQFEAAAMGASFSQINTSQPIHIINPSRHNDIVGVVYETTAEQVETVLQDAVKAQSLWANLPKDQRAAYLNKAADLMQQRLFPLMVLLSREAGKTYANTIAEVREAIDFLRYYAGQMLDLAHDVNIKPLGTVLCISPWNFPLAIFTGQISAALVAGNTVIAKPAEQTPLIAAQAVQILWEAGIPKDVLQLLPGQGETIGAQLSQDSRIQGIMFTGSTEVAKILQKTVSQRLNQFGESVTLIAETGGQNAMIVDSSALTEQVVLDVINSAFDSAGQRCSALRVLCVQEDNFEVLRSMLVGAMQQLRVGDPSLLCTDIGPVIDFEAKQNIQRHIDRMKQKGHRVYQLMFNQDSYNLNQGTFIPPTLIELPNLNDLEREVFGPVLHLIKYKSGELEQLLEHINHKGYGLTMGLHTRIDETIHKVMTKAHVGNLYINRNIVGAVVGVQPFGGEGLSGTGPKAGGPLYLYRLMHHVSEKKLAVPYAVQPAQNLQINPVAEAFKAWVSQYFPSIKLTETHPIASGQRFSLIGPTGEDNQYVILPRENILSLAKNDADQAQQLFAILSIGSHPVVLAENSFILKHLDSMPTTVINQIKVVTSIEQGEFDAVLHHGNEIELLDLQQRIAARQGAIIGITHMTSGDYQIPVERFVIERAISINTAAAGGNASLMTMSGS